MNIENRTESRIAGDLAYIRSQLAASAAAAPIDLGGYAYECGRLRGTLGALESSLSFSARELELARGLAEAADAQDAADMAAWEAERAGYEPDADDLELMDEWLAS